MWEEAFCPITAAIKYQTSNFVTQANSLLDEERKVHTCTIEWASLQIRKHAHYILGIHTHLAMEYRYVSI